MLQFSQRLAVTLRCGEKFSIPTEQLRDFIIFFPRKLFVGESLNISLPLLFRTHLAPQKLIQDNKALLTYWRNRVSLVEALPLRFNSARNIHCNVILAIVEYEVRLPNAFAYLCMREFPLNNPAKR